MFMVILITFREVRGTPRPRCEPALQFMSQQYAFSCSASLDAHWTDTRCVSSAEPVARLNNPEADEGLEPDFSQKILSTWCQSVTGTLLRAAAGVALCQDLDQQQKNARVRAHADRRCAFKVLHFFFYCHPHTMSSCVRSSQIVGLYRRDTAGNFSSRGCRADQASN